MQNLSRQETAELILREGLIAIFRHVAEEQLFRTTEVFLQSGITVAEVTLNTSGALELLGKMTQKFGGEMLVGAGTVTTAEGVRQAVEAGARFIVSPTMVPEVIKACQELGVVAVPGALTPTEISQACNLGAEIIKVFPANSLGPSYFKEIRGPLTDVNLAAVGGITLENGGAFLVAGAKVLGVGSSLVSQRLIQQGDWEQLGLLAKQFKALVSGGR
ncbi:hypothetical protein SY88_04495 [Clostridiales bacterium PH28_bin88]|nr:hypothetical protein SY88_04495 [Clostridiales bacterium PH28_bin88]